MRTFIAKGGIATFLSSEEFTLVEKIDGKVYKTTLDERESEVASMLTRRGVFERYKDDEQGIYYVINGELLK